MLLLRKGLLLLAWVLCQNLTQETYVSFMIVQDQPGKVLIPMLQLKALSTKLLTMLSIRLNLVTGCGRLTSARHNTVSLFIQIASKLQV